MRLLVVTQYFWPEVFIINDLVKLLADLGHEVSVVTGKPNYPDGDIYPGYGAFGVTHELFDGRVNVWRVPLMPRREGGALNLFLNYLSFALSGMVCFPWLVRGRRFDAILVFAPSPVTSVLPAIVLKWLKKAHLALWIQDLWPESLEATGFVRHKGVLRLVGAFVKRFYASCDTLLVPSRAFRAPVSQLADPRKIIYYPNSMNVSSNAPFANKDGSSVPRTLSQELEEVLANNFCVVFAGNIGSAQAVETWIQAAQLLQGLAGVKIVVVGSGSKLDWLNERKCALGLDNLILGGRYPSALMPSLFERAQALLVSLTDEEIFSRTIPSKVQAYLAAGKPIIAALNGEGARVIEEAGAGLVCAAEDAQGLANCVRALVDMSNDERDLMGRAGRSYFFAHFDMKTQAGHLIEILQARMQIPQGG